jgi:dipeptidyl aminopeptidase/acylaminoacyl peptidase
MTTSSAGTQLTFEEIADRLVPGDPLISPDGSMVALVVRSLSNTAETPDRSIWLSKNGAPARRFTGGASNDHGIAWSPDSTRIAFLSNRDDAKQLGIYVIAVDGGEAQRLGDFEGSLATLSWSPDGASLAVLRVDPDSEQEQKRKDDKDDPEVYEDENKFSRLWIVDVESGKARCITHGSRHVLGYGWHPDSQSLAIITTPVATVNARFAMGSVWLVPVSGGLARHIADFTPAPGSPVIREVNGTDVVAVIGSRLREDPAARVWTVPLAGGEPRTITPELEGSIYGLAEDPRSPSGLLVRTVERTHGKVYALDAGGGDLEPIPLGGIPDDGSVVSNASISRDSAVAVAWSRSEVPVEIHLVRNGLSTALTSFGEGLRDRLVPGTEVRWTSTDGTEIEGVLLLPRGYEEGKPCPLFVQVHGGPTWQWENRINLSWHDWGQMLADRGYAVLLPNPRGSAGYGSEFERLLIDDVGGGECADLISGAQAMVARGIADPDRLAIGGWSWGGYLTAMAITQTSIFKAAIMGAGVSNLVSDHGAGDIAEANMAYYSGHPYTHWDPYADRSPVRHAASVTTPTLILHGGSDVRVHPSQSLEFHRALQVLGVPVQFVRYPREGHGIEERAHQIDLMRRIVDWLERYVPAR